MTEELKDLATIFDNDLCKDVPLWDELELVVWVDTVQCKPVTHKLKINGLGLFDFSETKKLLLGIDAVFPIVAIIVKGYKVYRVTKTEEFMNKKCEA
jgi:hypothetical protein